MTVFDKLPEQVQHLVWAVVVAVLGWGVSDLPTFHLPNLVSNLVGGLLALVIAYVTPLTKQYGVGSKKVDAPDEPGMPGVMP